MKAIVRTLIVLFVWPVLVIVAPPFLGLFGLRLGGGRSMEILAGGFYLLPVVGIIAWGIFLFCERANIKNHKLQVIIVSAILIGWLLGVVFHIRALIH